MVNICNSLVLSGVPSTGRDMATLEKVQRRTQSLSEGWNSPAVRKG